MRKTDFALIFVPDEGYVTLWVNCISEAKYMQSVYKSVMVHQKWSRYAAMDNLC